MINKTIEEFLYYAKRNLSLDSDDYIYLRNFLLHEFNALEPYEGELDYEFLDSLDEPNPLISSLKEDVKNISEHDIERLLGIITPYPSKINDTFFKLYEESPKKATDYFYDLMVKNNYIKTREVKRDIVWEYEGDLNVLKITINLSKPEKRNEDIAKLVGASSTSYPKCLLCYSNLGFYGSDTKPGRTNIRMVPLKLDGEDWFMQYSPYAYYKEHAIIVKKSHEPMEINDSTFRKLIDFVDLYPHYFIGSNADLPIVGGSILDHEHFQGGLEEMPMMKSSYRYELESKDYPHSKIYYLEWLNTCFKIVSKDKDEILSFASHIYNTWLNYDNIDALIISKDENGRHQAITPVVRKINDKYELYIILRNNRCNEAFPDGIFHAHKEYQNIKSEGIGLIEAMGLFILPGRLERELSDIRTILVKNLYPIREIVENNKSLEKHLNFINRLVIKYGRRNSDEVAREILNLEVGEICENILKNTSVFKNTIDGQLALFDFIEKLNLKVK